MCRVVLELTLACKSISQGSLIRVTPNLACQATPSFSTLHKKSGRAWYQKSCAKHRYYVIQCRSLWNTSSLRLLVEFILCLYNDHTSLLGWPFDCPRSLITPDTDRRCHVTSCTRPSHCSHAKLKSWEWPGAWGWVTPTCTVHWRLSC